MAALEASVKAAKAARADPSSPSEDAAPPIKRRLA